MIKQILAAAVVVGVAAGAPFQAVATIDITVAEVGSDVVFSYSGALDLTGANVQSAGANTNAFVSPLAAGDLGAIGFGGGATDRVFEVTSLPSFGTGSFLVGSTMGPGFGVFTTDSLGLPLGYVSNTQIVGSLTLDGQTLASLGLIEGSYLTGSLPSGDFVRLTIPKVVPEPALALLGLSGTVAFGLVRRRRGSRARPGGGQGGPGGGHDAGAARVFQQVGLHPVRHVRDREASVVGTLLGPRPAGR